MSNHNNVFQQLLTTFSRHEFESLAREHHCGQKLRSITRRDQFLGMSMSQLSGRQSLRDIEAKLKAQEHKLYHLGGKPIAKTSLARINEKQPYDLYQSLFYKLLGKFKNQPNEHKFRFKNPLYSLDASLIDKHYVFLTNHFDLSSRTIAAIYKDRWQVELFFKAIKQNLKIKAFVGT